MDFPTTLMLMGAGVVGIAGSVSGSSPAAACSPRCRPWERSPWALGFQRLLPAVQQMYAASTYLGAYRNVLAGGLELLEQAVPPRLPGPGARRPRLPR
ncbi:MAG: hypothetical protein FJ083_15775 [Cyanobacteria bacterium K_Offshore_surface_m2_239]|nr:hypothetical protein [Cyanobacteria bacterium K_Offshore_surface_m2_239]